MWKTPVGKIVIFFMILTMLIGVAFAVVTVLSPTRNVVVQGYSLTFTQPTSSIGINQTVAISGDLTQNGVGVSGKPIYLIVDGVDDGIADATTDSLGHFSFNWSSTIAKTFVLQVKSTW